MNRLDSDSAFTFVELLVSVVLVGALSTMSIVNLSHFKERAYDASALQVQTHLVTAVEGWINAEWDQSDRGSAIWRHQANNTNIYTGSFASELNEFFSSDINGEYAWYITVDTTCILGGTCTLDRHYRANIGHCRASRNTNTLMPYHIYESRRNTTVKSDTVTVKSSRNCSN